MDAATPFRRWWCAAGLVALATLGCQSDGPKSDISVARPQAPTGPVTGQPVVPAAPGVPGQPQPPTGSNVNAAGYVPGGAGLVRKPLVPEGTPRIKVVAVVGAGNIITDQEVWNAVRQRDLEYLIISESGQVTGRDEVKERQLYQEHLRKIIDRELILDEMFHKLNKNGKASVVDEIREFAGKAADRTIREYKKHYRCKTDDDLRSLLAARGMTLPVIRRQVERQLMADEYIRNMLKEKGRVVGLPEVRGYYDRHPDEFRTPDKVKWLDIFISFSKFPSPRAAYDYADTIRKHAAAGADFVALSRQYDHGLSGPAGGVGTGTERGKIQPPDVEPTVWSLQPGQVSHLVQTPAGYHIIKVAEREIAGARPLDQKLQSEIRDKLKVQMHEAEYKKLTEDLWRRGALRIIEGQ